MAKCMQCGGAKKMASAGVGKASSMAKRKMAKGGSTTNKLNNARGFAKAQMGGSNTKMMIYGVPNAGMTGPNRNSQTETMKKGGAKKSLTKAQKGTQVADPNKYVMNKTNVFGKDKYKEISKNKFDRLSNRFAKQEGSESFGNNNSIGQQLISGRNPEKSVSRVDKVRQAELKKRQVVPPMKKGGSTFGMLSVKAGIDKNPNPTAADRIAGAKMKKAKFGASVKVQRSPKAGKVTAVGRGYAAVGQREPGRIIKKTIGKKK